MVICICNRAKGFCSLRRVRSVAEKKLCPTQEEPISRELFVRAAQAEQQLKWAKIWFGKLAAFHSQDRNADWPFTADDVIAYLRSRRDAGLPAWKRLKIIEGLRVYQKVVRQQCDQFLVPLQQKMLEIVASGECSRTWLRQH